jgi:hypothetical protein
MDRIIIVPFAAPSLRLQYGETAARGKPCPPGRVNQCLENFTKWTKNEVFIVW